MTQGSRRRADAPAAGYPGNIPANPAEPSYPQPPGSGAQADISLREKNAKKAKQEDALPASTQGIAASLDRVVSAKKGGATGPPDVEEGGIKAHGTVPPAHDYYYRVCVRPLPHHDDSHCVALSCILLQDVGNRQTAAAHAGTP